MSAVDKFMELWNEKRPATTLIGGKAVVIIDPIDLQSLAVDVFCAGLDHCIERMQQNIIEVVHQDNDVEEIGFDGLRGCPNCGDAADWHNDKHGFVCRQCGWEGLSTL